MKRLEAGLFHEGDEFLLFRIQPAIDDGEEPCGLFPLAVEFFIVDVVDDAVQDEVHEGGDDGFAPFGEQKVLEVRIPERRILDVNFADNADADLLFVGNGNGRERFQEIRRALFEIFVGTVIERAFHLFHALRADAGAASGRLFIGLGLVEARHDEIAVKNGIREAEEVADGEL